MRYQFIQKSDYPGDGSLASSVVRPLKHLNSPETGVVTVNISDEGVTVTIQGRPTNEAAWTSLTAFDATDSRVVRLMRQMRVFTDGEADAWLEVTK